MKGNPFHSPHLFLPEKLSIQGTVQAALCLGELSPHLNDTAQHHKLNKSWGRDMKNYFQNTHKLFQWLAPLHIQTPAHSSKQNWPRTEVLLHQPLSPQLFCGYFLKRIWGRDSATTRTCAPSPCGGFRSGFKLPT